MKIVSDTLCRETLDTHFVFNISYENRAVYEVGWKNIVKRGGSHMIKWSVRVACWIPKATNTRPEYVLCVVFPLQQWLHEEHLSVTLHAQCVSCLNLYERFRSTASDHRKNILIRGGSVSIRRKKST